jgi:outer membrane immunogenic protein
MLLRLCAASLAACVSMTAVSQAADLSIKDEPVPVAQSWTGFYVGVGGGGLFTAQQWDWLADPLINKDTLSTTSVFATLQAGYDLQVTSRVVAGVFADVDFATDTSKHTYYINPGNFTGAGGTPRFGPDVVWTVGGRVGVLANSSTLVYALAGYTRADFDDNLKKYGTQNLKSVDGYTLGGGVETRLFGGWSLKAEYRYSEYGPQTLADLGTVCTNCDYKLDTNTQSVRVSLNYKFGQGELLGYKDGGYKDAPAVAYVPNWTGFSVGVGVGGVFVNQEWTTPYPGVIERDDYGANGFLATVQVAYDKQFYSRYVAGVFADFDWTNAKISMDYLNNIYATGRHPKSELDFAWTVGGRLGMLVSPDTLVYALAGYTRASFDDKNLRFQSLGQVDGYMVGAGIETFITQNVTLKGEYRFSDFGHNDQRYLGVTPGIGTNENDVTTHSVRAVLSYKFSPFDQAPLK